jgi:multiple sugar transport system substrate-binding protein
MKKVMHFGIVLMLILLPALCFATGSGEDNLSTEAASLKLYGWDTAGIGYDSTLAFVEWFQEKYPLIKVEYQAPQGSYHQAVFTDFAAGIPPDVMYMGGYELEQYNDLGIIENLTSFTERDAEYKNLDLMDVPLNYFRLNRDPDEDMYALPTSWTTYLMYFNKTLFEEAGLETPDVLYERGEWNRETFLNAVRKLSKDTNGDGEIDQYGWEVPMWFSNMHIWFGANGLESYIEGDTLLYDRPEAREMYQLVHDLIYEEGVVPTPEDLSAKVAGFNLGNVAMTHSGNWNTGRLEALDLDWEFGITILPKFKQHFTYTYCNGIAMSSRSKFKDQAWLLMREFAVGEGARSMAETGSTFPPTRVHFESMNVDPIWIESLQFAVPVPRHVKSASLREPLSKYHSAYFQDPEGSLDEMVANMKQDGEEALTD